MRIYKASPQDYQPTRSPLLGSLIEVGGNRHCFQNKSNSPRPDASHPSHHHLQIPRCLGALQSEDLIYQSDGLAMEEPRGVGPNPGGLGDITITSPGHEEVEPFLVH